MTARLAAGRLVFFLWLSGFLCIGWTASRGWIMQSFNIRDVVISEVAWMGTQASTNDEWIELYNNTSQAISLVGWTLVSLTDGSPSINLSGAIPARGFFLLERTDDTTVSDISADQIYTGSLSNTGEALVLKDPLGNVIDTANGDGGGWPAGDNTTKSTMERLDLSVSDTDTNWATNNRSYRNGRDANNNFINGTPKAHKPPYINVTSPTGAAPIYVKQGTSFNVSFTSDEAGTYVIRVGGTSCGTGTAGAGANAKICALPSNFAEGIQDLTVAVTDNVSILGSGTASGAVHVDNTPPTALLTAPNGGEAIPAGSTFNIQWSCTDPNLGATPINLRYSTDGGITFSNVIVSATENDGSFVWNVPAINSSFVRVRVQCTDLASNNTGDDSNGDFAIVSFNLGDVNDDGKINALDARMAQQHADGAITLTGTQFLAADVDQDSDVDSDDATAIAKKGIGLPTGIPGFALDLTPQPPSLKGKGEDSPPTLGEGPGERSLAGWLFLAFTLPALTLLRRSKRLAMLVLMMGSLSLATGCVGFLGLPPPAGPATYLTSTSMPNGATRPIYLMVQELTSGGGLASLQGRITFPTGVAIQSVTGQSGFVVKALCGTVSEPCSTPNELRFSLVKSSAGGVSNGAVLLLAVQASGASGQVYTLSWAGSTSAPIVLGGNTNVEITGFTTGNGQVKVR